MTSGQYSQYGLRARLIRGYAVVKTSPPPRNILAEKKVATQLRSFRDPPPPWYILVRKKVAMRLTTPPPSNMLVRKEEATLLRSGYVVTA